MKLLPSILFTCGLLAVSAQAVPTIIFADNFNRTGPLAGSLASTPGGNWTGGSQTTNGDANVTYNAGTGDLSYQTITLTGNTIYQLATGMAATGGAGSSWLGFRFGGTVGNGASIILTNSGINYAFTSSIVGSPTTAPAGDFRIELITTASLTGSTVNYFRNGSQFATGTINANGINRAFLQNLNDVKGLYGDVILTATPVPEPSSALLGLVGVLGLAIRRRRC